MLRDCAGRCFTLCHSTVSLQTPPPTAASSQQAVNTAASSPRGAPPERRVNSVTDTAVSEEWNNKMQTHTKRLLCLPDITGSHVLLQGVWEAATRNETKLWHKQTRVMDAVIGAWWVKTESRAATDICSGFTYEPVWQTSIITPGSMCSFLT